MNRIYYYCDVNPIINPIICICEITLHSFSNQSLYILLLCKNNENKMNERYIKTHVNLLHMWRGRVHEVRSYPGGAWHTVTRQCLTVVTAVLCQSRRGKHMSRSNTVLTNAARVVVQSHILKRNMKICIGISSIVKNSLIKSFEIYYCNTDISVITCT